MKEQSIISDNLISLLGELMRDGNVVIGRDGTAWKRFTDPKELKIDGNAIPSKISYKQFVFAKTEPLFYFKNKKDDYELIEPDIEKKKLIFFGVKPCDASSIEIMSKVFNWDYKDHFFNQRAENTVVIGAMCGYVDEYCFCTSVNSGPGSEKGSDIFLIPVGEGRFAIREISERGKALLEPYQKYMDEGNPELSQAAIQKLKVPDVKFSAGEVRNWIGANFEHRIFESIGETCVGCGQCAFVCPVCHCFDIVDEECSYECGRRMKNWDACQFSLFTLHSSGHNPRETQGKRYRQRIAHKFKYYQDKFDEILCSGCGRCSRGCPAGIDIARVAADINFEAKQV